MSNLQTTEQPTSLRSLLQREDIKGKFEEMLGKRTQGFLVSVMNAVNSNSLLRKADHNSVIFAAATAASLDLPIDPNLGFAYIIPYNSKQPDGSYKSVAQFQMGYKGFIQLAQRSGQFKTISAAPIYEGQIADNNPLTGIRFDFSRKDSDTIIGYAGYFQLINGFEKTLYMTVDQLKQHGAKYSKTYAQNSSRWKVDFEAMATKTVIKLLLSKYAPLSIEMQKATIADQAVVNDWEASEVTYIDNEADVLDPVAHEAAVEQQRILDWISKANTIEELEMLEDQCNDNETQNAYRLRHKELTFPTKDKK